MSSQEILEKAILKAIDGGWKFKEYLFEYEYPNFEQTWNGNIIVATNKHGRAVTINYAELIIDHDFAKALWGEGETATTNHRRDLHIGMNGWKFHLQQMVIADDPIKYLSENI